MAQVSYGTITITDTTDIERIYMVYAGSESNITPPDVDNFTLWKTDITQTSGTYIWQRAVVKKSGIEITAANFQQFYGEPVCITGEGGRSIKSIISYYCNYGIGTPDENYSGWKIDTPEYDEDKPNYWVKTIIIYVDDSETEFESSGSIVTIEDGEHKQVTSLSVSLEPIQDLNGYDKPWSGGNGKNKFDISANTTSTAADLVYSIDTNNDTIVLTGKGSGQSLIIFHRPIKAGEYTISFSVSVHTARFFIRCFNSNGDVLTNSDVTIDGLFWNGYYQGFYATAPRTFNVPSNVDYFYVAVGVADEDVGDQITISSIQLEEGSTATAYEPYSNICPISGRTDVVTQRTGKNLAIGFFEYSTSNVVTTPVYLKAGQYTISFKRGNNLVSAIYIRKGSTVALAGDAYAFKYNTTFMTFNADADGYYYAQLYRGSTTPTWAEYPVSDVQLELGSTATDYEPYEGDTYTTALGRTVYGGTLDVVSGELVVDRAMVDLGTLTWTRALLTGSIYIFYCEEISDRKGGSQNLLSSAFQTVSGNRSALANVDGGISDYNGANKRVAIRYDAYTSASDFKTAVTGQTLVYELATPQTYQLTPQEVELISGQNNVWSDEGDVEVSGFTIVDRDIQIHLDNGLTNALAKSADAQSKATEALGKANEATQAVALMGGHFIYKSSSSGNSTPAGAGVIRNLDDNPANWGYNTWIGSNGIDLRYGENILSKWMTTGISFYNTNHTVTSTFGDSIALASNGATITIGSTGTGKYNTYINSQGIFLRENTTAYATLDNSGLTLSKGGIRVNPVGSNNSVYISSDNLGNTIPIGGNKTDWRAVIGSKFAVDSEGNLYANGLNAKNANIEGEITATSLIIGNGSDAYNGEAAINVSGYDIVIYEDSTDSSIIDHENTTYLYPVMYHNGEIDETVDNTHYIWFMDNIEPGTTGDAAKGGIIASYGHSYRVTYDFDDSAVGTGTLVQERIVDPSKYITKISDTGITIHPEDRSGNDYLQINGDAISVIKNNNIVATFSSIITVGTTATSRTVMDTNGVTIYKGADEVAQFGVTARIGRENNSRFLINYDTLQAYDSSNVKYFEVNASGISWGTNTISYLSYDSTNGLQITNTSPLTATRKIQILNDAIKIKNDADNYLNVNSNGIQIYKGGDVVANFGTNVILGKTSSNYAYFTSQALSFHKGNKRMLTITTGWIDLAHMGRSFLATGLQTTTDSNYNNSTLMLAASSTQYDSALKLGAHNNGEIADNNIQLFIQGNTTFYNSTESAVVRSELSLNQSISNGEPGFNLSAMLLGHGNNDVDLRTEADITADVSPLGDDNSLLLSLGDGQYYTQIKIEHDSTANQKGTIDFNARYITLNGSTIHSSDKRLKTHIDYLKQDAVKFIQKLKPARFIKDSEEHLGFYAQDVEEINLWQVNLTPNMGEYKGLSYIELIAPLVAYCQHLEERIRQLEGK